MTVALDFYTFSNVYPICSGLTVFLILHVHANKEIMKLYINVLYLCFGVHEGGWEQPGLSQYSTTLNNEDFKNADHQK